MSTIGVAIITKNRNEFVKQVYKFHQMYTKCDRIIVIDDHSDIPLAIPGADVIKPPEWLGVAKARNYAMSLLNEYEYIFLLDDDIIPKMPYWVQDHVNMMQDIGIHICNYQPSRKSTVIAQVNNLMITEHGTGCFIVMDKVARQVLGGFDTTMGYYGHEDTDYYTRARAVHMLPKVGYPTLKDCEFQLHACDIYGDYPPIKWMHESALKEDKWKMIEISRNRLIEINKNGDNPIYKPFS